VWARPAQARVRRPRLTVRDGKIRIKLGACEPPTETAIIPDKPGTWEMLDDQDCRVKYDQLRLHRGWRALLELRRIVD
jgi:hypothetical protein